MAAIDGLEQIILPVEEAAKINDPAILSRLVGELPRIDFTNYRSVQPAVDALKEKGVTRLLAGNLGGVQYAQQQGFSVAGDFALNITNHASAEQYAALGCTDITASFELNLNEVTRLGQTPPCGIIAYGYLPLMITRNCPARLERNCSTCTGISMMYDRLGNGFFVSCGGGRKIIEIFNHLPLYLADRLPELQNLAFITLYFTVETQQQCARVLYEYQNGGGKHENITRGLYYRNIM